MTARHARQCGVTLAELLLVVALLGLAASLAVPRAAPASVANADAAAGAVAHAFRFAQREAVRTGAWHRVSIDTGAQVLRVSRLELSGAVGEDTGHPVLHPVDKREYRIAFGDGVLRAGVTGALFQYNSGASASYLSFGPDGAPADITGYWIKTIDALKNDGQVTVRHGAVERVVKIEAVTGRVTF
jgi:prepilin-type N-terminal cleavage/methylation domain-containing protein